MIEGRIVKGIGGFYYVKTNRGLIESKPRGIFRKKQIKPMVGDKVMLSLYDGDHIQGVIEEILPRLTVLLRPTVTNVEQCIVVVSVDQPKPDLLFVDRLLVQGEANNLENVICFNKIDLDDTGGYIDFVKWYKKIGYTVVCTSVKTGDGIDALINTLKNKISVLSGLSGVGKSSLINSVQPDLKLKTGKISSKLKRGRHTTRHVELMELNVGGMVVDTPGFSSLKLNSLDGYGLDVDNLCYYFLEFQSLTDRCRFYGCRHMTEPDCAIKKAAEKGEIAGWRYQNYISLMEELQEGRRKRYD